MKSSPDIDRRFATTLARGLSVLRAFRASDDGLGNLEISERTGIPKSSVSRLTFTLQTLGYLTRIRHQDRYRLGPSLLALGNVAMASISFVEMACEVMQALADKTGTLVLLGVRDDQKLLLVKTWRPCDVSSIWLDVGYRIPMAGSSSGQALLAALSDVEFTALQSKFDNDIDGTGLSMSAMREDAYAQLLSAGFVIVRPEHRYAATINAVSVPFRSPEFGEPVAFSCGAMPEVLSAARMRKEVGPDLRDAALELQRMTGQSAALVQRG